MASLPFVSALATIAWKKSKSSKRWPYEPMSSLIVFPSWKGNATLRWAPVGLLFYEPHDLGGEILCEFEAPSSTIVLHRLRKKADLLLLPVHLPCLQAGRGCLNPIKVYSHSAITKRFRNKKQQKQKTPYRENNNSKTSDRAACFLCPHSGVTKQKGICARDDCPS
ncbi:hypothetical protein B0H34DRAFT_179577 [Crassisporium funariophilum]|nr:hypothetical protein B0H34DRAFT_179577 [Crassisporium funariophilum]